MGSPFDPFWHISQQQCKPPQLCHQNSSKNLKITTYFLVLHGNQAMQTTSPNIGQP